MKLRMHKSVAIRSLISSMVLAVFLILATGSVEFLVTLGFPISGSYDPNLDRYTEEMARNTVKATWEGPKNRYGDYHGWVTVTYTNLLAEVVYIEEVYYINGKRNGVATRYYPDGSKQGDFYLNGMKIVYNKASHTWQSGSEVMSILEFRYPWYLFMMEAFGFDRDSMEQYLDTLDQILSQETFDPMDFDSKYDDALEILSETPYDTISTYNEGMSAIFGIRKMKNDQLRLAVLERHYDGAGSTFDVLQSSYPNYISELGTYDISEEDLSAFCAALDDSLAVFGPLDNTDPFFPDSVDNRLFAVLGAFLLAEESVKSSVVSLKSTFGNDPLALRYSVKDGLNATPAEVAEVVVVILLENLITADLLRESLRDIYLAAGGIPDLPLIATEYGSSPSSTSAILNGHVVDDGGAEVTSRGIAWAAFYNPNTEDNIEPSGAGDGQFSVTLEGLTEGQTYYARAYATNAAGTAYGNVIEFVAQSTLDIHQNPESSYDLKLYPNPASTEIHLEWVRVPEEALGVMIIDPAGRMILRKETREITSGQNSLRLDISGMPEGLYIIKTYSRVRLLDIREFVISR